MKGYQFLYKHLRKFFTWFFRIEIVGAENEPTDRPILVCSNHLSNWDVVLMAWAIHRQVRFLAKKELFSVPIVKGFVTAMGAFPTDRGTADLKSLRTAIDILKSGGVVGIFPQGHRMPKREPKTTGVKNGCAVIAHRANATILPMAIKTKGWKILPFRKVTIYFGKPIPPEELDIERESKEEYTKASEYVFSKITELLDE